MSENLEYLSDHLSGEFQQIIADRKLKSGEKVEALIAAVDQLLGSRIAGVSFRHASAGIERTESNGGDLEIFTDANGYIEHIDFADNGRIADLHFH